MSAKRLPRELGVIIRCDGLGGLCGAMLRTANIRIKANRSAAKSQGWIRGGRLPGDPDKPDAPRKWSKRLDFCPAHAVDELKERAKIEKATAERRQKRADKMKVRLAAQLEAERVAAQGASVSP